MFKVEVMNKADKSAKTETAFKLFDKNKDGFITREEFTKVEECTGHTLVGINVNTEYLKYSSKRNTDFSPILSNNT